MYFSFLHPKTQSVLVAHAVGVIVVATVVAALGASDMATSVSMGLRLALGLALLAISCVAVQRILSGAFYWDHMLTSVAEGRSDPFALPTSGLASPAARGWNRVVELGRRWQALTELEAATTRRAAGRGANDLLPIVNGLSDGMAVVNAEGRIVIANNVFAAICGGESADDVAGKTLPEALGTDEPTSAQFDVKGPQPQVSLEVALAAAGGPDRRLRCVRRPRWGESQPGQGFVWTVRDVTQQRLAESMREKFLSAATHELRTPLANIRAYAESLDMSADIDPESRKRFYNIIQSESVRLAQLIDDLLDISRMQAGALSLDRHETDLGRLAEEAASKVHAQMQEKQLQFRCEFPPKFPKALVDKAKLTAAIVNLLGNAAKYTPDGGKVTFRIEVSATQAQFVVIDTGIGIAEDELPRVFERFFRSTDDRVRDITGSGLGLALTLEVARLHGGDVQVESTLNVGSTFRLIIPLDAPSS